MGLREHALCVFNVKWRSRVWQCTDCQVTGFNQCGNQDRREDFENGQRSAISTLSRITCKGFTILRSFIAAIAVRNTFTQRVLVSDEASFTRYGVNNFYERVGNGNFAWHLQSLLSTAIFSNVSASIVSGLSIDTWLQTLLFNMTGLGYTHFL